MASDSLIASLPSIAAAVLRQPNVNAVGIGERVVGGMRTGTRAVKVFVNKKLPRHEIDPGFLLPWASRIDGQWIEFDVDEMAPPPCVSMT